MPEDPPPQRFLIATGVTVGLPKTGGRVEDSVGRMAEIFQGTFRYERVNTLGLNPTAEQMRRELRHFALKCGPRDFVAFYHTGHATEEGGKHRLWMADTGDDSYAALPTEELAEKLLGGSEVSNLLFILDTCEAGKGAIDTLIAAGRTWGKSDDRIVLAITSAHPRQRVRAGDFAHLFSRAVQHPATAGYDVPCIPPLAIVRHIKNDEERKAWQTVSGTMILSTEEGDFLPNPRYNPTFRGLDVASQLQLEEDEQRRKELEEFFDPRARGVDVPQELEWYFEGRHAALRDLTAWLSNSEDPRTIVVTGDPGSGKSAVIGRVCLLSDREWSESVPRQGVPKDTIPPPGSIDVAIHASKRTSDEVFRALCHAAGIEASTPAEFLSQRAGRPMVAAIDAIDEAVDPDRLVSAVLNPLTDAGPRAGFRMLLGTRPDLLDRLSATWHRVNLDDPRYADPASLRVYAEKRLRGVAGSPYTDDADPARVRAVADAVATAAGRSFLVARITSRTLAAQPRIADPADQAWRDSLPGTAADAMQHDLESRLGDDAVRACDLLRPLAYAGGNGLPWEDIWAPLAGRLAGREYHNKDVIWLRRNAGSYMVGSVEADRTVYRLYHASLAEYLRLGQDAKRVHGEFVEFLLRHVPRTATGLPDWPQALPYIKAHLATHAAAAGKLGELVTDPGYLAYAAPLGLLAAFAGERDPDMRLTAAAYERAMHRLRGDLADRLSYLELAARRARAESLAERIADYPLQRRWSVRWNLWPADHPHRVLAGHRGPVREVIGFGAKDQTAQAASVGDDGSMRLWDIDAAQQLGVHEVGHKALAAIDVVDLPGPRRLAVVLSAAGFLTAHELPSMSRELTFPVRFGLRDWFSSMQLTVPEMRCVRLPDGRWAAVTGGPGMVTAIWDIRAGTPIARLQAGLRPARLEFRQLASGVPVIVSIDQRVGAEHVFDFATGRHVPNVGSALIATPFTYYCRLDGTPVICLRDRLYRRLGSLLFDLTGAAGEPTGRFQLGRESSILGRRSPIRLRDGTLVEATRQRDERGWQIASATGQEPLVPLLDTGSGPEGNLTPGARYPKHARPSDEFPFTVALEGSVIRIGPAPDGTPRREEVVLTGHGADVTDADALELPGAATRLVSSSFDGTVRVWDIGSGGRAASPATSNPPATVLSTMTHQDQILGLTLTTGPDGVVAFLDLDTGEQVFGLNLKSAAISAATCGWVPGIGEAAITFVWGTAYLWRLSDGELAARFRTYAYPLTVGQVPLEARYMPVPGRPLAVTYGHDNRAVVWDLAGRRIHAVLGRHSGLTSALACGVTAKRIHVAATGGHDNRVNIWDARRGRRIGHLRVAKWTTYLRHRASGHPAAVNLVLTGPQMVVLVLCEDGKLRIFRKRKWRPGYQRISLDAAGASSLVVLPLTDGRTVAVAGGRDGRLCAWDVDAALAAIGHSGTGVEPLMDIETEVTITNLCTGPADTVVLSTLNGLAAFMLYPLPARPEGDDRAP